MYKEKSLPIGYKQTKIGIIPTQWAVKSLAECFSISAGRDLIKETFSAKKTIEHCFPIFSNSMENRGLYGYTSNPRYKAGSLTVTGRGTLGVAEFRTESFDAIIRLLVLTPKMELCGKLIAEYINYKKPFFFECTGIPQLTAPQISKILIPIPPIEEQKKIVEVLSEWDKAIELQTKLIEKLELRKRALMQRLLTGRVRLNGFSDKWEKKRLSEVGVFLSSNTLSRDKLNKTQGFIQNIHYGDILIHYPTIVSPEQCQIPYINEDVIVTSDLLQDGDIVFADTAEDNTVGKAIEIVNVSIRQIVAGLHTIPFRPNKGLFAKQFLGYYVNSVSYQKQLEGLIQGIKVCSISKSSIKNTYLQIPSLGEQTAIAKVLIAADKEIKVERQKLSILHTQKRGLMQQLLTGKKRIMSSLRSV